MVLGKTTTRRIIHRVYFDVLTPVQELIGSKLMDVDERIYISLNIPIIRQYEIR